MYLSIALSYDHETWATLIIMGDLHLVQGSESSDIRSAQTAIQKWGPHQTAVYLLGC